MKTKTLKYRGIALGLCALVMTLAAGRASADDHADGTISVTPVAALSITVGGNIALGSSVDVGASTYSVAGQALSNLSLVGVKVKGQITGTSGWTADATTQGYNTYVLKALAAAAAPDHATLDAVTALSSSAAGAITGAQALGAAGQSGDTTNIWYKLAMPTGVSSMIERTITITYTAEAL